MNKINHLILAVIVIMLATVDAHAASRFIPVDIPAGQGGLNASKDFNAFPITDLTIAEDLTFEDGTWRKDGGAAKINTTVITNAPSIIGLHDFIKADGTQIRIAATSDGKIVSFNTGGIVNTLQSGLGTDKFTVFIEGGGGTTKKLFRFNGNDAVGVTSNGTSMAAISTPPTDWSGTDQPTGGVLHNGRLWGFGNGNDQHRIYGSVIGDHEDFTGTGKVQLPVFPGEGEKIVAAASFMGRLFIFKFPRGIYWLDDSSTDTTDWLLKRMTSSVGMAGPLGLVMVENDVLFLSSEGNLHILSAVQEYGDFDSSTVFYEKIGKWSRDNIDKVRLPRATAIYYGAKKKAIFCVAGISQTVNNRKLIMDMREISNPKFSWSTRDICESIAITKDANSLYRPMMGNNAGFVYLLDEDARSKDSGGYMAKGATREIEFFPSGVNRANLHYLETVMRVINDATLKVDVELDGKFSEQITFDVTTGGTAIPSFNVGTSEIVDERFVNTRKKLRGDARRMRLIFWNDTANEDYSLERFVIGITQGSDRR